MKQITLILLAIICINSCSSDDSVACFAVVRPSLLINIVDADGQNLIENGFYTADDIVIRNDNSEFPAIPDPTNDSIGNFIQIPIVGNDGINNFLIEFSENETDTLVLDLQVELSDPVCNSFSTSLEEAIYNEQPTEVTTFSDNFNSIITIVK